ncbi:BspA family leucine-rich repeat surface protein [Bifidobacterium sp. ESL0763]|uniref:BspA family leucine-rich repeat surface protein n=1 Tax=Bifidobacterium sp. ESL0763 TaxID=2983227 RepID=UPI0023F8D904|nr:BspA family leucine-rich repeat surface protein [Bifidobacterium sp. ESL0763]MDF7664029.1 BspA family leucine-rich repeat surface protein [Bifidobacterium sp. ESL0763]
MRERLKATLGIVVAAAMLAIPALASGDETSSQMAGGQVAERTVDAASSNGKGAGAPGGDEADNAGVSANKSANRQSAGSKDAANKKSSSTPSAQSDSEQPAAICSESSATDPGASNVNGHWELSPNAEYGGCTLTITATTPGADNEYDLATSGVIDGREFRSDHFDNVTSIVFEGPGKTRFPEDSGSMFNNNNKVASFISGDFVDTSHVTDMSSMFSGWDSNESLKQIDVAKWDTSRVTDMSWMFSNSGVVDVDLSGWATADGSSVEMSYMFNECHDVKNVVFGRLRPNDLSELFYDDESLEHADLNNLKPDDRHGTCYFDLAFSNCKNLRHLDISGFDASKVVMQATMFDGTGLETVNFFNSDASELYFGALPTSLREITVGPNTKLPRLEFEDELGGQPDPWEWVQLPVPGTVSEKVDATQVYNGGWSDNELVDRINGNDPTRVGTYVLRRKYKVTMDANAPEKTSAKCTSQSCTAADAKTVERELSGGVGTDVPAATYDRDGNVVRRWNAGTIDTMHFTEKAPASPFELMDVSGQRADGSYQFVGWNTAADGTGKAYRKGDPLDIEGDTTLYAQWAPSSLSVVVSPLPSASSSVTGQTPMRAAGSRLPLVRSSVAAPSSQGRDAIAGAPHAQKRGSMPRCGADSASYVLDLAGYRVLANGSACETSEAVSSPAGVRRVSLLPWWIVLVVLGLVVALAYTRRNRTIYARHRRDEND